MTLDFRLLMGSHSKKNPPKPELYGHQKDLAWKLRGILTNWLIQVHTRLRLLPETLYLAVNIIDRFLSAGVVSLAKLQLVGITCMFLAAKMKENVAPSAVNFLYCADSLYTEAVILQAEKYTFKTLEWNMGYLNPISLPSSSQQSGRVQCLCTHCCQVFLRD